MVQTVRGITSARVLDLAILVCRASLYFQEAYRYEKLYDPQNPLIDRWDYRVTR